MKNYITGIITGISLTASAVMFMGAKMQDDEIVARKITLVDKNGQKRMILNGEDGNIAAYSFDIVGIDENGSIANKVQIGTSDNGIGQIGIFGNKSDEIALMSSTGFSVQSKAYLSTMTSAAIALLNNKNKTYNIQLLSGDGGSGLIEVLNEKGERILYLGGSPYEGESSGKILVFNGKGEEIIYLGETKDGADGLFILKDRYGDIGWGMTGKKK